LSVAAMIERPPLWDTSCPDWEERIRTGRSLIPDLPLFAEERDRGVRIFKRLRIPDVFGQPTMGQAAGPWLFDLVAAIFGSYDPELHIRMIQEFFLLVPKKNSKSSGAAGIMLTAMLMNRRPAGEFTLIAPTKEVADIAFSQMSNTINADDVLTDMFHQQRHIRTITNRKDDAYVKIKAADTDVITGGKQIGTLIDETHVFAEKARAKDVFTEIRGALAARPDGFLLQITTQSKKPPAGVFKAELAVARKVRDGKLKLPMLPILYELPRHMSEDGGWQDERTWPMVNPNLNRSVSIHFLRSELVAKASSNDPADLALFASQHFNVEIGLALQADRWAGADYWKAAARKFTLAELLDRVEVAVISIDGGGLDDLLGLTVLGRETRGTWLSWTKCWVHRKVLALRAEEAPRMLDFAADGDLVIVDDMADAYASAAETSAEVDEAGLLWKVGLDPMGVGLIIDALAARHIENVEESDERVMGIAQGWKLSGSIKTTEVKLAGQQLLHADQACMDWQIGNCKAVAKGNAIVIDKQVSGTGKIDGPISLFGAVAMMTLNPPSQLSVYSQMARAAKADEPSANDDEIDFAALGNRDHPQFEVMKARFEAWQAEQPDED
jgi:phage terminase large subunit-like protein